MNSIGSQNVALEEVMKFQWRRREKLQSFRLQGKEREPLQSTERQRSVPKGWSSSLEFQSEIDFGIRHAKRSSFFPLLLSTSPVHPPFFFSIATSEGSCTSNRLKKHYEDSYGKFSLKNSPFESSPISRMRRTVSEILHPLGTALVWPLKTSFSPNFLAFDTFRL